MASQWDSWTVVDRNKLSLNLMCLELPHKLDVQSLQIQVLPCWPDFFVFVVCNATTWEFYYYSMGQHLAHDLVFLGFSSISLLNQLSFRSILSGASLCEMCCTISIQFRGIMLSLMNVTVENSLSNTTWNWGETWPVSGFRTRTNDPLLNVECPRYIPARECDYHLGSPDICIFNLSSNT